ncbi:Kiwa anti-phage protein KwaB-like domain-containing protein [Nakamurella leprariae]|uniref:DUF4868 domain-containing protein n=1 Tax=Nakamurella leprariae TaxID=2803911 RepID=A0A938YIB2_9ACTN|nr:Kiwa anti-phage protein KwaB-like domain-containing protein [Nakamurella leprariae]MBM9468847.1 DUF4868 domain-containing protein [Nakamurella leprariae]
MTDLVASTPDAPSRPTAPIPESSDARTPPAARLPDVPSEDLAADRLQAALAELTGPDADRLAVTLLLVTDHRTADPRVFEAPIDAQFAAQLREVVIETGADAAGAELVPARPGFAPSGGQWVFAPLDPAVAALDERTRADSTAQYDRNLEFGRRNLLVVRIRSASGADIARLYQGFAPEQALTSSRRLVAFWSGERFDGLTGDPLIVDRSFRVMVTGGTALMSSATAYERLFGALEQLRASAAAVYEATFARLPIIGAEALQAACLSDLNMMRKLTSIGAKLAEPRFADAMRIERILVFLHANPHIDVLVDRTGPAPRLVFDPGAQQRWSLLKLLDDDYLHSRLTDTDYEANSKTAL